MREVSVKKTWLWLLQVFTAALGLTFWLMVRKFWHWLKETLALIIGLGFVALLMVWLLNVLP